jgi:hypothetical protein
VIGIVFGFMYKIKVKCYLKLYDFIRGSFDDD